MSFREVTRFNNRGLDGPVSGAIGMVRHQLDTALVTNTTVFRQVHFPAGVGYEVTDIQIVCGTVVADVSVTVGDTAAGTQVAASASLSTGSNELTIKDGTIEAGGFVDVRFTSDTTGSMQLPVDIFVTGYPTSPPTSLAD